MTGPTAGDARAGVCARPGPVRPDRAAVAILVAPLVLALFAAACEGRAPSAATMPTATGDAAATTAPARSAPATSAPATNAPATSAASRPAPVDADVARIDAAIAKAAAFLVAQQSDDGAFRSTTYGALKDGRALTPLVASALLFVDDVPASRAAHREALAFVAAAPPDARFEYPVYTLAGSVLALSVPAAAAHAAARDAFVAELAKHQLSAANGWRVDRRAGAGRDVDGGRDDRGRDVDGGGDVEAGGFGYWHDVPVKPAGARHELLSSNLSATLWATGALQLAGVPRDDPRFADALAFVLRCRNDDGGFVLTPTNPVQNKAGDRRSYGSATADGLRALLRLGVPRDDPRVLAAKQWLHARFAGAQNVGDFPVDRAFSRDGSRYYATWTIAHAFALAGGPDGWAARVVDDLLALQRPDGAWRGATDLREDDPLVATPQALAALALARHAITGVWRAPLASP